MKVSERITELRKLMKEKNIDVYMVPSADFHNSEYVGEHFKARGFITGFTGSAGTAVITMDKAGLWTDGRYFLQAENQLKGSGVKLFKMGEPGVVTVEQFLNEFVPENGTLGFDGRVVPCGDGQNLKDMLSAKGAKIVYEYDLVDKVWIDRPVLSEEPVFALDVKYAGESVASKLERVRNIMKENKANAHIITTLDDIGWLLNIRGNDVEFFPLILSYLIVREEKVTLYIEENKVSDEIKANLAKDGVELKAYNDIYEDVKSFGKDDTLLIDDDRMNYAMYNNIGSDVKLVKMMNPTIIMKAIKNEIEIENIKKAEIKDSIAHLKYMRWVKENFEKENITELKAQNKLEEFRHEQEGYMWPSFESICSFGPHAAIVHYTSSPETDVKLEAGNVYLSDTGANFMEGSTDITRTFALGEVKDEIKEDFTITLQANLRLTDVKFLKGCTGMNLDIVARAPFWEHNKNYNHGTGHGVGYLGNIHEPPTGFRWQYRAHEIHPFENGMVITNEPGIYIEGSHGIRLENEILVREGIKNEYGQFMYFEAITFIPFDLDAIKVDMLSEHEKHLLNTYHKQVFEKISPYLNEEETEFLKAYTRAI